MSHVPLVRDVMAKELVLLREDMEIYEAIHRLLRHKDTGACVVDADRNLGLYRAFSKALETGIVRSAATPAKGGLAAALARAALAGGLGAEVDIDQVPAEPGLATDDLLFAESNGRFVARARHCATFLRQSSPAWCP